MFRVYCNYIQHQTPTDDPDSFISLLLILLCCLAWFYACIFHICLPISALGLWEWFMILTLFARLTYVNVLHWIVRLYYIGVLVNESIGLILVIQTFYPSAFSVLHNKDIYPAFSIVWSTTFPFIVLKSHYHSVPILYDFLIYWYYVLYIIIYISMCNLLLSCFTLFY